MLEILLVALAVAVIAAATWWYGPEIPR